MKKSRFSETQIFAILQEAEVGTSVADLGRKYNISDAMYYNWKAKYGGMTLNELKRLKELEEENRKLKEIVAEQALDIKCLKAITKKNF
ncbi:MAG: transposase [Spirochaetia bacterium]|nr:transposase [Spirochaetia bacterium]